MKDGPKIEFRWASEDDEPQIRALVGSVPMPGAVSIRFAREPNYFLGASIMGDSCEVLIAREPGGPLAAMGCRAESRAYINGQESQLGYIGQIRVADGYRGLWLIQRGAEWFREASNAGLVYFGVIASDNPRARKLLTADRLPGGIHVRRMTGITTMAFILRRQRIPQSRAIEVLQGSGTQLKEILGFLTRHGPAKQFFPAYDLEDFVGGTRMRGLRPSDLMLARRSGQLVGVMAVWDQSAYKQDVVEAYGPGLRRLRPIYDLAGRLLGFPPLPRPGDAMPLAFAACICVPEEDPNVIEALLSACADHAFRQGKAYLMLGLADNDPLLAACRRRLHVTYHSDLFAASWSAEALAALDARIPYIEIAAL